MSKTRLLLLAAPSGAGKNSFLSRALRDFSRLQDVITYTTREPRVAETPGQDYHFLDKSEFQNKVKEGFFAEWAQVHENLYGVSHHSLQACWEQGYVAIMDIDVQGVKTLKKAYPEAVSLFIMPPSVEELKIRILARDRRPPPDLNLRLENAREEIAQASQFDYQIVNDDLEESYGRFKKIVEDLLEDRLL